MSKLAALWVLIGLSVVVFTLAMTGTMIVVVNNTLVNSYIDQSDYSQSFKWLVGVCVGLCGMIVMLTSMFVVYLCKVTIDHQLGELGPFEREHFIGLLEQQRVLDGKVTPIDRERERQEWEQK